MRFDTGQPIQIPRVTLEKIPLYVRRNLNARLRQSDMDQALGSMCLELESHVLAQKLKHADSEQKIRVPKTAFDHLKWEISTSKPRWFAKLCAKLFKPPEFVTLTVTFESIIYRTYPDASLVLPENTYGSPIEIPVFSSRLDDPRKIKP